jgi:hypothetical protein
MAAVILYDVSVETSAKASLGRADETPRQRGRDLSLPAVLTALVGAGAEPREVREARHLHELRNLVQHDGQPPSADGLERSEWRARDFLTWVGATFFDADFWGLSRSSLVRDDEVRAQLEIAERHGREAEYDLGAAALAAAFELARDAFRADEPRSRVSLTDHQVRLALDDLAKLAPDRYRHSFGAFKRLLQDLTLHARRVEDRVEALALGASASDCIWFRRRFPRVGRTLDGNWHTYSRGDPPSPQEFARGLDFVMSAALHWQQFPAAPQPSDETAGDWAQGPL